MIKPTCYAHAVTGWGPCDQPRRPDSYFCELHDQLWQDEHPKRPLWTLEAQHPKEADAA